VKPLTFVLFIILFIQASSAQNGNKPQFVNLDLAKAFAKQQEVQLSRFVDKVTYLPLETHQEALIPENARYELTDDFVIVKTSAGGIYRILLFDRNSGKFIREIGKQGRGPGEYSYFGNSNIPYNHVKKEIYAFTYSRDIIAYDLSGKNTGIIRVPGWSDPRWQEGRSVPFPADNMLDENIFAGYFHNLRGWENRKLVLFTKDGIVKIFPNHMTYIGSSRYYQYNIHFYNWDNKLYFIEGYCDTIYQVTKESLIPRYYLNWGQYNAPYSKQNEINPNDYFFTVDLDENDKHIFFKLLFKTTRYLGFVEKSNNSVTFCKKNNSGTSGFKDDISGLMDVIPVDFTQNNEMIYIIQPIKLLNWLKENPEKAQLARTKLQWLKNIDEFSNPIIAIGK
jgi:hypothetical protein